MTSKEYEELFDRIIERDKLHGRSFAYGVSLYTLLIGGYFAGDDELMDIEYQMAAYVAAELEADETTVYEKLSTKALAEATDLSVLDEIAKGLAGMNEDEE